MSDRTQGVQLPPARARCVAFIMFSMCIMCMMAAGPALAQQDPNQDPNDNHWHDTAELSYVVTAGNSETNTLGFRNKLWRAWEKSAFELNAGGVRAESTRKFAVAQDPTDPNNFDIEEESDLTAEAYFLNGRYDRKFTARFFWFTSAGWERNTFAGIDNRYTGVGGLGNQWFDTEKLKFRTDYSATYTKEDAVVSDPDFDDSFVGARLSYALEAKFGASTTFTSELIVDDNLEDTADLRGNLLNAVAVAMSKRLALKVSVRLLYDHQPAIGSFDLFDTAGTSIGTVDDELDTLDTIFTTSLVFNI